MPRIKKDLIPETIRARIRGREKDKLLNLNKWEGYFIGQRVKARSIISYDSATVCGFISKYGNDTPAWVLIRVDRGVNGRYSDGFFVYPPAEMRTYYA